MPQPTWISTHLFYYDSLSTLITECVKPVIDICRARNLITTYFFVRYWEGGPHIRLRLLPTTTASEKEVTALLEDMTRKFFAEHPSRTALDAQQYEEATGTLTRLIYGEGRQIPLQPADSLQYIPYQPEYELYGGVEAMPYVETLFMHSSAIALELLTETTHRNQLTGQAVAMLLLAMLQYEPDVQRLAHIFTDQLRIWHRMPAELKMRLYSQFARQYQGQREQLLLVARRLLKTKWQEAQTQPGTPLTHWQQASSDAYQSLQQLERDGMLYGQQSTEVSKSLLTILFRCLHMHNNRMGIVLSEEAYIFFLVRQVLHDLAGLSLPEDIQWQTKGGLNATLV